MDEGAARPPAATLEEIQRMVDEAGPFAAFFGYRIEQVVHGEAVVRQAVRPEYVRPGPVVSGPITMGLADVALWIATMSVIGIEPFAVTTDMTTHFLRGAPADRDLLATARIVKAGRRLVIGQAEVRSEGLPDPAIVVTGTYSVPPRDR